MATARATRRSSPAARTNVARRLVSRRLLACCPSWRRSLRRWRVPALVFLLLGGRDWARPAASSFFLVAWIALRDPPCAIYAPSSGRRSPAGLCRRHRRLIVLCLAFALAAAADSFGVFPGSRPGSLFDSTYMSGHGGVAGEALWAVLHPLLGGLGIDIIVVALTVVGLLLVSGSSIGALARRSRRGMHAAGRAARDSARSLNQTLDERRRLTDANLRTRWRLLRSETIKRPPAPQPASDQPAVRRYRASPNICPASPSISRASVDGRAVICRALWRAPADEGPSTGAHVPRRRRPDEQEETGGSSFPGGRRRERDDGETLAALNQLAVRSWSLPRPRLLPPQRRDTPARGGPAAIQEVSRA